VEIILKRQILINIGKYESRAAVLENDKLCELYYEIPNSEKIVGCIIKGKVSNIVKATQSAFVDIGIHKDAYLTLNGVENYNKDSDEQDIFRDPIENVLKVGQQILLQVLKEPSESKGPRSTMILSFPGRYLVFMPRVNHIGVSKKITQEKERDRLREIGQRLVPEGSGLVFRTVAEGLEEHVFRSDLDLLLKMWEKVEKRKDSAPPRTILHRDIPLHLKIARDYMTDDVQELIIDNKEAYDEIMNDCSFLSPMQRASIELYKDSMPIFDKYGIEKEIEIAMQTKVWLKSGGYLYIEKTEAMYCIDVNSGRFSGGSDLEETVFRVNMEAAEEIARQVRLRNMSGMIIVDFIDMETASHRSQVLKKLREGFKNDHNKPNVWDFTELGLVQMTRRRTASSIEETRKDTCSHCDGSGKVFSYVTVANMLRTHLLEEVKRFDVPLFEITADKHVIDLIRKEERQDGATLEQTLNRRINFVSSENMPREYFRIEPILKETPAKEKVEKADKSQSENIEESTVEKLQSLTKTESDKTSNRNERTYDRENASGKSMNSEKERTSQTASRGNGKSNFASRNNKKRNYFKPSDNRKPEERRDNFAELSPAPVAENLEKESLQKDTSNEKKRKFPKRRYYNKNARPHQKDNNFTNKSNFVNKRKSGNLKKQ